MDKIYDSISNVEFGQKKNHNFYELLKKTRFDILPILDHFYLLSIKMF